MPGITNPDEEYFKDGLWAWDPAGAKWLKLIIDPLTNQLSVAVNNDAEIHQTTPADLTPGICGWDGSAWHKLPLVWGYSDRWVEYAMGVATGAGDAVAATAAVGAGYVYVLQSAAVYHNAGANKYVEIYVGTPGAYCPVYQNSALPSGTWGVAAPSAVLKYEDTAFCVCVTPGDGKQVLLRVWGYKMKIAE